MAFNLSEFDRRAADGKGTIDALARPCLAVHAPIELIAGQSVRTAALNAKTRLIRFTTTEDVRVRVYPTPDGGPDTNVASAEGDDGLSEHFFAGEHVIGVAGNDGQVRLAIILAA